MFRVQACNQLYEPHITNLVRVTGQKNQCIPDVFLLLGVGKQQMLNI